MVYKKAREDFEAFAAGVKRLKELEKELNSLNTKNFRQEERDIRRKLRSVHLIPQIEREINELKAKISGVDIKALKAQLDFEQSRKLAMLEHKEEELERQLGVARKGMLTENEVGAVDNLPLLKKKISYLRDLLNKDNRNLKEEANNQLLEEIKKLKKNIETNNKEIQQRITEIEARRNAEKFVREHRQKVISRSQELGLKPKFLERIEHIDDSYNPISVKEINILSPFGIQQQKRKKETKQESSFKLTEEILELPPMPLSEDELTFSLKRGFAPEEIYPAPEIKTEKRTEFGDIKREVESKIPSIPGMREDIPEFRERQEEREEKPFIEIKPRKICVPNKKFLEKGKYNMFFDNLMSLKELSYYNPEMFEEIKPLKEFQKNETEKSLENCEIIAKNLLKIRTKILIGIK